MPQMNFDLEDGKPPVSFALKPEDCARFMAFMRECDEGKKDAERYRWMREQWTSGQEETGIESIMHVQTVDEYDAEIDAAMRAKPAVGAA